MIKIIIIEDLPMILEGITLLLCKVKDFKIIGKYANGKEFIDNISSIQADIVLTDINMPIMDGLS